MTGAALSFVAGVLFLQQQAALPHALWLLMLPVCAALLWPGVAATRRCADGASLLPAQLAWRKVLCIFAALAFGFLWAAAFAHLHTIERGCSKITAADQIAQTIKKG